VIPVLQWISQDEASDTIMVSKHNAILKYIEQTSPFYIQTLMYMPVINTDFVTNPTQMLTLVSSVACRFPSFHSYIFLKTCTQGVNYYKYNLDI